MPSYDLWFGFNDNFLGPGIFKENLLTGVTKNADVNKILTTCLLKHENLIIFLQCVKVIVLSHFCGF